MCEKSLEKPTINPSARHKGGFYINKKFVFKDNWELLKRNFSKIEQQAFEKHLRNTNIN